MSGYRSAATTVAALAASAILLTGCVDRAGGQGGDDAFPSGTITMYTPTQAGGATDLTARTLGAELEGLLDTSVVVDNRPGGAGSVGMEHLAGQQPDGYSIAVLPVEVSMLGHLEYDIDPADYDFLGQVNAQPGTIAVPADSPFQTLDDLVEAAAAEPGSMTVSNAGAGSIWEAGALALAEAADVELQGVPFDGGAPAVTAAIGGQVDAVVASVAEVAPAHADGQLRVLAVFLDERAPVLEDVPTATEQGYDLVIGSWAVIAAPTGLDDGVRDVLESAIADAVASDEYVSFIESSGNIPQYRDAAEATEFVGAESERFQTLLAGR